MDKKVLIIGPTFFDKNESVQKAFMQLGWDAKVLGYLEDEPLYNRVLSKVGVDYFKSKKRTLFNEMIVKEYKEFKPEMVFILKGNILDRQTLDIMRGSKRVLWMMDSIFRVHETMKNIDLYDYRFMYEKKDAQRLSESDISAKFLPCALDEHDYYPIVDVEQDIDIVFVGSMYIEKSENREQLLDGIISRFPDRNIQLYGKYLHIKRPDRLVKYYLKNYRRYYKNVNVNTNDVNRLYARAKIAINMHHSQTEYSANQRFFELMGSKVFQIVDETEYIRNEFLQGENVVCFGNVEELLEKVEEYIDESGKRERISQNGYDEVLRSHTFKNRIEMVLSEIYGSGQL
ncbi:spore maturation protein CgeB [Peptoclostridium litorale DSM 5388]|uniref:Spore protein YkvP/CgeB glycosyl transferase-like domain-containing protein n=1 Tax=Peptoclostridium litorale DSM 5388 TaxID=1121324 RepID=A0A069REM0_PEPLI|nr:glycosyltransferase [Peptoclostridium litorale]KDR94615.1 hypothetical protein CLIT_14c00760 [Peptoclostridium litorale DSM 5388]SIO30776.1 spore maturation protein CgeB [Peptoclostridium litorale DSM 5388]